MRRFKTLWATLLSISTAIAMVLTLHACGNDRKSGPDSLSSTGTDDAGTNCRGSVTPDRVHLTVGATFTFAASYDVNPPTPSNGLSVQVDWSVSGGGTVLPATTVADLHASPPVNGARADYYGSTASTFTAVGPPGTYALTASFGPAGSCSVAPITVYVVIDPTEGGAGDASTGATSLSFSSPSGLFTTGVATDINCSSLGSGYVYTPLPASVAAYALQAAGAAPDAGAFFGIATATTFDGGPALSYYVNVTNGVTPWGLVVPGGTLGSTNQVDVTLPSQPIVDASVGALQIKGSATCP